MSHKTRREIGRDLEDLKAEDGTPEERVRVALWASLKNYYGGSLSAEERRACSF